MNWWAAEYQFPAIIKAEELTMTSLPFLVAAIKGPRVIRMADTKVWRCIIMLKARRGEA